MIAVHDTSLFANKDGAIGIPVTRGLVEFLIEQNMSRVLENIERGESRLGAPGRMTTLDEALDQATSLDRVVDQATTSGEGTTAQAPHRAERQP